MPSQYLYRETIRNEYLGVSKTIRAMTRNEFEWLARAQLAKWDEQETRRRQAQQKNAEREVARHDVESTKSQAAEDTAAAKERIEAFGNILVGGLGYEPQLDWNGLLDRRPFYPFVFDRPTPDRDAIRLQILGPEPTLREVPHPALEKPCAVEFILPFLRRWREERNRMVVALFEESVAKVQADHAQRIGEYRRRNARSLEPSTPLLPSTTGRLLSIRRGTRRHDAFLA